MADVNIQHVLKSIVDTEVNERTLKQAREKIAGAFDVIEAEIKANVDSASIQECVDLLNKAFEKAKMPIINIDDFHSDLAKVKRDFEQAIASMNGLKIDVFDDVLSELQAIQKQVKEIASNKGGLKLIDEENLQKVMKDIARITNAVTKGMSPYVKSVKQIDDAIARARVSAEDIQEAFNFTLEGKRKDKVVDELDKIYKKYMHLIKPETKSTWEEQYIWMTKFTKAYEVYLSKLGKKETADKNYTKLYNENKSGSVDRRNMLQNIINRGNGTDLVGYAKEPWALESTLKDIKKIIGS